MIMVNIVNDKCNHLGLCDDGTSCGQGDKCCRLMKRVFHAIQEYGCCDIWNLKLCEYHISKICYMFKKHEYDGK